VLKELAVRIIPFIAAVSTLAAAATANPELTLRYIVFLPVGQGCHENAEVDGVAMTRFNENTGWSRVNIVVHGLCAQTTYAVAVGDAHFQSAAIYTNSRGTGNYSAEFLGNVATFDDDAIRIFIDNGTSGVSENDLRAISYPL
jgi:hypothetical protein